MSDDAKDRGCEHYENELAEPKGVCAVAAVYLQVIPDAARDHGERQRSS